MRKRGVYAFFALWSILSLLSPLHAEQRVLRYIVDGDTVVFKKSVCRLAYIDSPESKRNKKAKRDILRCSNVNIDDVVESGREAKRYLHSLMQKGRSYDVKVVDVDRYGRDVCLIYDQDQESINERVVKNGFAVPFWKYIRSSDVKRAMVDHVRYANTKNKGVWRTHRNVMECMNR